MSSSRAIPIDIADREKKAPRLRVEPIDPVRYLEEEARRLDERKRGGWSRAYARRNQLLPYGGARLTPGQVDRINLWLDAAVTQEPQIALAAALLSAVMTTGRNPSTLQTVRIVTTMDAMPCKPTLHVGETWTWWLAPGEPRSPQLRDRRKPVQTVARPTFMPIPVSTRTRRLIERSGYRLGTFLFSDSTASLPSIYRTALDAAGARTPSSIVETWLFQRLTMMAGGDVALAAIVTGQVPVLAATAIQYTMIDGSVVQPLLDRALDGFDTIVSDPVASPGLLGSRNAPTTEELAALVVQLTAPLRATRRVRRKAVAVTHNALTLYTIIFGLFATGGRPSGSLVLDLERIDPTTGFLILDDKPTWDNFKSRLVWVSDACRDQLSLYQQHLAELARLRPRLGMGETTAPFLIDADDACSPLTRQTLKAALSDHDWPFPLNAGRHFLRSALVGRLDSETLHAFLGHWHLGTEPWSAKSGFDPIAYRAALSGHVPSVLDAAGFRPLPGLT